MDLNFPRTCLLLQFQLLMMLLLVVSLTTTTTMTGEDYVVKRFYETLGENERDGRNTILRTLTYDSDTESLYVGAVNRVYSLDVKSLENVSDSYKSSLDNRPAECRDSETCSVDLHDYVQLVLPQVKELLVCGTARKGQCVNLHSGSLRETTNPIVASLASTDRLSPSFGFFGSNYWTRNNLIVATSVKTQGEGKTTTNATTSLPEITTATSQFHFVSNWNSEALRHTTIDIIPSLRPSMSVIFKGGFRHDDEAYFFSNQETKTEMRGAFVSRMCHRDPETLVEFRLTCKGTHSNTVDKSLVGKEFSELRQVKFLTPSDSPENSDSVSGGQGLVFAIFREESALCIYNMADISDGVIEAINTTFTDKSPETIYQLSNLAFKRKILQAFPTADTYARNRCFKLQAPISTGKVVREPVQVVPLSTGESSSSSSSSFTSLAVRRDDHLVAYVGTTNGKIFKLKINSSPQPLVELPLGIQPFPIKDLLILSKEELYALTKKEVLKIKTFDCSRIRTCRECVPDIHCGWCASTKSCVDLEASCPVTQHYLYDTCISHTVTTLSSSLENATKISCRFEDRSGNLKKLESEAVLQGNGEIICPLTNGHLWKSESLRSANPLALSLVVDDASWAESNVTITSCQRANNCTECLEIACNWNVNSLQCQDKNSSSSSLPSIGKCPQPLDSQWIKAPSGLHMEHSVEVKDMPPTYNDVRCRFSWPSKVGKIAEVNATIKKGSPANVVCSGVKLEYTEGLSSKNVTLSLLTATKDSEYKTFLVTTIQVYKCRHMAQNCGQCQALNQRFNCLWCMGLKLCDFKDECKTGPVGKQDICTDLAITSFHPIGAPTNGNTTVTVEGRNFGIQKGDIKVSIGKTPCTDVKIISTDRLTCKSPRGYSPGHLTITKSGVTAKSTTMFHLEDPTIFKMEPTSGLVSGGTKVTLIGSHFNHGNNFNVTLRQVQLPIISRSGQEVVFRTLPVDQKMPAQFYFNVDGQKFLSQTFQFLEDPIIESFEDPFTIAHGGTPVVFKGRWFQHLNVTRLIIYLHDGTNKTGEPCRVSEDSKMSCPTPDLSSLVGQSKMKFHFGLHGCSLPEWLQLTRPNENFTLTPLKTLAYYPTPNIESLPKVLSITHDVATPIFVDVKSSDDNLLKRFKDLSIIVGGHEIKEQMPKIPLRFKMPHFYELSSNGKDRDIVLKVGNFRKAFGKISLSSKVIHPKLIGIIVGLVLAFTSIVIITYFIFRCYKMKHRRQMKPPLPSMGNSRAMGMTDCNVSIPNLREVSSRGDPKAINPYMQAAPGSAEETLPLVGRAQDDENYFQNIIHMLDILPEEGCDIYIPREKLQLGNLIGKGNFGSVYIATLIGPEEGRETTVAVKMIDDPDMKEEAVENFVREGLMMKKFDHENVMSLFGLCISRRREPMVVLPYMTNGDLRTYVKDSTKQFTARELLRMSHQVSQGMAYLSALNFIHRDLAARNCMIDDKLVVKVADFGLSHELHEKNYYSSKDQKAKLPIKWMALESLESFIFTTKSDVWSFGVLMWEVMTRGVTPYPDVEIFETRDYLATGRRLRKPKYCPDNVYDIMMRCWQEMPDQRPSFTDLVNEIEIILNPPQLQQNNRGSSEFNYLNQIEMQEGVNEIYLRPC